MEVKIHPKFWVDDFGKQLWNIAKAGVTGNVLKKDRIDYNVLEVSLYYAMLRPLFEQGQQIRIEHKPGKWKKRHIVETDVSRIEALCNFSNFNKTTGFLNARKAKKKTTIFYNVVIAISATHIQRFATKDKAEEQSAYFKVTVASLNPLATTVFPPEFERSSGNLDKLERYLQLFPVRLHREGYEVEEELRKVCKQISKKRKREAAAAANGGDATSQ